MPRMAHAARSESPQNKKPNHSSNFLNKSEQTFSDQFCELTRRARPTVCPKHLFYTPVPPEN